jgi:thiol-disulfide isomerase/thioredoxin
LARPAISGTVIASFSAETAFLLDLEISVGGVLYAYVFSDETTIQPDGAVRFDAGGREEVTSFSGVVGGPAVVGMPAPDFTLGTLDGSTRSLASAIGCRLIIDFWALWCVPCVRALPALDALAKRLAAASKPVALWTVAIIDGDAESSTMKQIREIWAVKELTLPVLIDRGGRVSEAYGVKALPTTIVIDRDGIVEIIEHGLEPTKLEELIARG